MNIARQGLLLQNQTNALQEVMLLIQIQSLWTTAFLVLMVTIVSLEKTLLIAQKDSIVQNRLSLEISSLAPQVSSLTTSMPKFKENVNLVVPAIIVLMEVKRQFLVRLEPSMHTIITLKNVRSVHKENIVQEQEHKCLLSAHPESILTRANQIVFFAK